MSLTPDEKIYNLATVLKSIIKNLKDKSSMDSKLADDIIAELERLRRI